MIDKNSVSVIFSPALFPHFTVNKDSIVVVIDVFRASTSIVAAFENNVKAMIPVETVEEAKSYKEKGYIVASEREGKKIDFADMGNSAYNFMDGKLAGKTLVYSTTNGTKTVKMAMKTKANVLIGSFNNHTSLTKYIQNQNKDVYLLCSGYRNTFCIEDTLFAGALADSLLLNNQFYSKCDSALISLDMWNVAKDDITSYLQRSDHFKRLKRRGLDDIIPYTLTLDTARAIPGIDMHSGNIIKLN